MQARALAFVFLPVTLECLRLLCQCFNATEFSPFFVTWLFFFFSEIEIFKQDFVLSNSVCNHTRDKQIGLPLRGRPILFITRMITDRIGLHSVLLITIINSAQ